MRPDRPRNGYDDRRPRASRLLLCLALATACSGRDELPAQDGGPDDGAAPGDALRRDAGGSASDADPPAGSLFSDEPRLGEYFATVTVERDGEQGRLDIDGLDVDAEGRAFITGFVTGTAIFGPAAAERVVSTVHATSGLHTKDLYVARYGESGALDWVRLVPSTGNEGNGYDLAVSRDRGEVFVSGAFAGTLSLPGGGTLTAGCNQGAAADANSGANGQMVLLALDAAGKPRWAVQADSQALVSGGNEVSVDAQGDVVQIGLYGTAPAGAVVEGCVPGAKEELRLGGESLPFDGGGYDSYVAVFDRATGALKHLPARIGGVGRQRGKAVDAAPGSAGSGGDVVLGTDFIGPTTLHAQGRAEAMTSLALPSGKPSQDMLVARLGYDGAYRWHVGFGSAQHDEIKGVASDPEGHVIIAGTLGGAAQLGRFALDPAAVAGTAKSVGFVARLDGSSGEVLWARVFGAEGLTSACCELVVDDAGASTLSPTVVGNRFVFRGEGVEQRFDFPAATYGAAAGKGLVLRVSRDGVLLAARGLRHADTSTGTSASELAVRGRAAFWTGRFRGRLALDGPRISDDNGARETELITVSSF